jgi:hypothetical protein
MSTIHAYGTTVPKGPLQPFDYDPGKLGPEEVEIKVSHCGVCHSDLSMLDEWGMSQYPFEPGHEAVGITLPWLRSISDRGSRQTRISELFGSSFSHENAPNFFLGGDVFSKLDLAPSESKSKCPFARIERMRPGRWMGMAAEVPTSCNKVPTRWEVVGTWWNLPVRTVS